MVIENTRADTFSALSVAHCLAQGSLVEAALAARGYLDQYPARRADPARQHLSPRRHRPEWP
ncbi:MAG: hypothetical protein VX122_07690 [Pseudomonadota bacterium]|nr:hypothetical protein [Pseudomonadota bacterium]